MDKLILKDALLNKLRSWRNECDKVAEEMGGEAVIRAETISDVIAEIEDTPVIDDVAQVVHSRWIFEVSDEYADYYHCDNCEWEIELYNKAYTEPTPNYCPNCGAKMDGGGGFE